MTFNNYIDEAIYQDLLNRYKKMALNKKELANELGVSVCRNSKIRYCKKCKSNFPIIAIAKFMSNTVKVA